MNPQLFAVCSFALPDQRETDSILVPLCAIAAAAAAAAKSLQSCPTLCDPIYGNPQGSAAPGILQARTLEWVAISFSIVCCSVMSNSSQPHGLQPTRLLCPWGFPSKSTGVGCHCLLLCYCCIF